MSPRIRKPIPSKIRQFVLRRDGGRCVLCGSMDELHLDHILPFSRGGLDTLENLRVLCRRCNLEKGASLLHPDEEILDDEWMGDDLTNTMICWTPIGWGGEYFRAGACELIPWPDPMDQSARLACSWGACNFPIQELPIHERRKALFQNFPVWVVRDGINPALLHRVLMPLAEYRSGLIEWPNDMPGIPRYRGGE